jgi:hypothetical protein
MLSEDLFVDCNVCDDGANNYLGKVRSTLNFQTSSTGTHEGHNFNADVSSLNTSGKCTVLQVADDEWSRTRPDVPKIYSTG